MEAAPPTPHLTAVNTTAPRGVTPRVDALLRLGQAALELAGNNNALELIVHDVPRPAFDAFPEKARNGAGYSAKTITLDGLGRVTLTLFATEPKPEPATDWFAVAQRITGVRP